MQRWPVEVQRKKTLNGSQETWLVDPAHQPAGVGLQVRYLGTMPQFPMVENGNSNCLRQGVTGE